MKLKLIIGKFKKNRLPNNVLLEKRAFYDKKTNFEGNNKIGRKSNVARSIVGYGTYLGENCILNNTKIGKYCSIASNVKLIMGSHPTEKFVSTHPCFYSVNKEGGFSYVNKSSYSGLKFVYDDIFIEIGNDVWIGEGVKILQGVKIGDGAVIGANSIVTRDIQPYSINVGTPARCIKYRFNQNHIDFLKEFKWWDKGERWIKENIKCFDDIEMFIKMR
ncbi:hexapeptide repeat-containing protein acetyltransferase [Clostridium sartagoforme AAU1]|uniref:Hexapeptide repeat-containing protein acetyltransferase n=1 Tax=Clostridium sartagoforme AAU1 TaxID=1202534 RepID=R9CG04_9CLOT|nr:CatB-related O-acetyltransferase [Clostridium sartagoforme]EOR28274.1 hexapeptide repeat-containing protein acetyltransferase [Clostridium sartagoforme AAU1]